MTKVAFLSRLLIFPVLLLISVTSVRAETDANSVRACAYIPGVSVPAKMPADLVNAPTATPFPTSTPPAPATVKPATTLRQVQVYKQLWNAVNDHYVYPDFLGHDWQAIGDTYKALITDGMTDDEFYAAMNAMVFELGDDHSFFQSPAEIEEEEQTLSSNYNYVGIGTLSIPISGTEGASIITVFHDSPAEEAGLLPHDMILKVDGGPIRTDSGTSRTAGIEGSSVTLTIQRPGEAPHDVTLKRRRVTGTLPIDYCIVPNTRIGYIFWPTFLDETIADQTRDALKKMTADGPLDGLILDNRVNAGGLGSVANPIMGFFADGLQGYFVTRSGKDPLNLEAEDIGGSQTVPLVVLVGVDTVSYGEITSGVLRLAGRARIVGEPTLGNVEQLREYDFADGSRAWIASATFQPLGEANGVWEKTGIIPDVVVPSRWDLFTEATDPALAKAVEMLSSK